MIIFSVLIFVLNTRFFGGSFLIYHLSKSMTGWLSGRSTEPTIPHVQNLVVLNPSTPLPSFSRSQPNLPLWVTSHKGQWLREWEGFKQPFSLLEKQNWWLTLGAMFSLDRERFVAPCVLFPWLPRRPVTVPYCTVTKGNFLPLCPSPFLFLLSWWSCWFFFLSFLNLFIFSHTMCHVGSYFPDQGSNLCALAAWNVNHWTTRDVPVSFL